MIGARHRQFQLRFDEGEFSLLALDPQTFSQTVQTPDVVQMTFRPSQLSIEAQVGAIHLFRFVNMPLGE